jgi:hypothetical protein
MEKSKSSERAETGAVHGESSPSAINLTATSRIDPPHEVAAPAPESLAAEPPSTSLPVADESAVDQIRLQADQLAAHLRKRQKELDHREAELNSRIARWESESRSARLWLDEREADAASRAEELVEQRQEVEKRLARLAAVEAAQEKRGQRCGASGSSDGQSVSREQVAAEHRLSMADLDRKCEAIQRRADHVDHCRASLVQLRDELTCMNRETLEIRLATEELWVQLSGAAPPAALTRSLGRIRAKLAEQYQQANAELIEQKKELEAIRSQLVEQHEALVIQKRRFDQWIADRQEELEQQASRLVAREQELLAREEVAMPV